MTPEIYNPLDSSLKGDVEYVLRDPRLVIVNSQAPPNSTFDRSWGRQKTWAYAAGTGDLDAFQFRKNADGSFKLGPNGLPVLSDYFIGADIAGVLNVQSNPSGDGFVAKQMPVPMRQPTATEKYVLVKDPALFMVERWMIREGEPTVPAPSPAGGSFTDDDRKRLANIERKLDILLTQ